MADDEVVKTESEEEVEVPAEGEDASTDTKEEELTEDELRETKNLYKLLKDPNTQNTVIRALADRAGLLTPTTPKETKEAKKELKDIISEALGPQYAFMVGPMERVFEKVLSEERASRAQEIEGLSQSQVESQVDSALSRLARETNGNSRKLEGKMIALMDQLHSSPKLATYDYLKLLYQTANSDSSAAGARQQIADRINRNAKDAPGRLQSTGGTGKAAGQQQAQPEKKGVKAAVEFAMRQLEKG